MSQVCECLIHFLLCAGLLDFAGCTVIGFFGGVVTDLHRPDEDTLRAVAADSVEIGSEVFLARTNGVEDTVTLDGVERVPEGVYAERYRLWRSLRADSALIPSIGDSVVVTRNRILAPTHEGKMAGWCRGGIVLLDNIGREEGIHATSISRVFSHGQVLLTRIRLDELLNEPTTPFVDDVSRIRVIAGNDTISIAAEKIRLLRLPADKHAWRTGLIIGLITDAFIVWVAHQEHAFRMAPLWGG